MGWLGALFSEAGATQGVIGSQLGQAGASQTAGGGKSFVDQLQGKVMSRMGAGGQDPGEDILSTLLRPGSTEPLPLNTIDATELIRLLTNMQSQR